jgi:hypothetical protein
MLTWSHSSIRMANSPTGIRPFDAPKTCHSDGCWDFKCESKSYIKSMSKAPLAKENYGPIVSIRPLTNCTFPVLFHRGGASSRLSCPLCTWWNSEHSLRTFTCKMAKLFAAVGAYLLLVVCSHVPRAAGECCLDNSYPVACPEYPNTGNACNVSRHTP